MTGQLRSFFIALNFLTRIPSPVKGDVSQQDIGQSIVYYPVVGLLLGLLLFVLVQSSLFLITDFPSELLAAIILTVWVLITGALHLDGLADSADAWIGGMNNRDRTLEIMKDPNCGPSAVVAIVLTLLLKWTALTYLLKTGNSAFLIVVPMLSRSVIISLFMTTLYVRDSGLGSAFLEFMPEEARLWGVLLVSAIVYWLLASLVSLILVIIVVMALRSLMLRRIGGMTGDTVGATVEITEAVALVALVI